MPFICVEFAIIIDNSSVELKFYQTNLGSVIMVISHQSLRVLGCAEIAKDI